jgi:hypothetical protein
MYDIMSLVTREERPGQGIAWYAVSPEEAYPATIARIREVLVSGEIPQELVEDYAALDVDPRGVARQYLGEARAVPEAGWKLALQERQGFDDTRQEMELAARRQALETARRWFTQALHVATGGAAMGVHILRDVRFRL